MASSLIHAYGLFWKRDEIDWKPGSGSKGKFQLLGRNGSNTGKLRVIDARHQSGIYVLYGNLGAYYVGLTHSSIGKRLKDHLGNDHKGKWDRFSWFGFNPVQKGIDQTGIQKIGSVAQTKAVSPKGIIKDAEALLIRAMAVHNFAQMKFVSADEWKQINRDEKIKYTNKL